MLRCVGWCGFALVAVGLPIMSQADDKKPSPYPPTKIDPVVEKLHGVEVVDPYRWLEDGASPAVQAWTDKENAFTRSELDKLPGRDKIHARLETLLDIGTLTTPTPAKGKYFYTKREGKQNQPILYVRDGLHGKDRVLLDVNELDKEGTTALDWWFASDDGSLVAYGLSVNGSEQSTLRVREVATGKDLPDLIERTRACSLAWTPDAKGFFYTRYPAAGVSVPKGEEQYHRHVFYHALGADPTMDSLVFGEGRAKEDWPNVDLSPDGRWLVVTEEQGWAKTEVYFADLQAKDMDKRPRFRPLVEGVDAIFTATPRNDRFYVQTNEKSPRSRLFEVDPLKPARDNWKEIIPEGPDILESIAAVGDVVIGQYMAKASSRLRLFDRTGKLLQEVALPTLGSLAALGAEWDGDELLFGFQSFTAPPTVYRLDLKKPAEAKPELWGKVEADVDFTQYEVEQVAYPSKDRTPITMFLAHKKGLKPSVDTATLLTGYGGFNVSETPEFKANRFLFLEKGGLLAIPNLRGGGEYGEDWHQAGMLGKKQNVFDDFLAAAEWLIEQKYTSRDHLVIQGGSNGGLLMGAALTQRPDLFRAVVCQVPLLDMLRYDKFLIARLWIPEYGSADDAEQFKWLSAYSPYQHVKDGTAYPAVLLEAAESDSRVDPLHARKMAARLQAATTSDPTEKPILLRLETKAGHGQGKPRTKQVEELTDVWSFVLWQLGVKM
jgi:prolyl oligopeptidase